MKKSFTRRDFLKITASVPLTHLVSRAFGNKVSPYQTSKNLPSTKVVLIRDPEALDQQKKPRDAVIQKMMDEAIMKLLDEKDPREAWQKIIKPDDIVGIKTNVWSYIPTTSAVEQAIWQRIREVGVPQSNISIDDRGVRRNPVFQKATALINARPARTHHWAGMGSCIKNYIMFTPRPSAYHGDSCADLARIWFEYNLKDKTRLNILVMLTPLFHGIGPHHYSEKYTWPYCGLIMGTDPVAVDSTGLRIIEAKRKEYFGEKRPLQPPAKHIFLAEKRHHLGVADPSRIELIKLGWLEGSLI
ncbi:MAG: hypothetical protein B5M54_05610 [Candidatus Aminicenantes bacterium 4484_214]|nr:MAG: hypothetical protein B5M54_05610 [Candidatus Aminicenantes bacterium 4484_214]